MDTRAVSRQDRRQTRCLETTFWPPTLSRDNFFCLETTFLSPTLCRDNLCCLETTFLSPTLSRDNVFAHLETTKKTSYNKKDNLRRYTPRRGNYGKITTQQPPLLGRSPALWCQVGDLMGHPRLRQKPVSNPLSWCPSKPARKPVLNPPANPF